MKLNIIRNVIHCNLCGDEVESTSRHAYVPCKCGACAADGGLDYLRRTFQSKDCYTDLSLIKLDNGEIVSIDQIDL